MTNTTIRVNDKFFSLWAPCCWTTFSAPDSADRCIELHREYHNAQFRKGRRETEI
jgi:hypothetical protein